MRNKFQRFMALRYLRSAQGREEGRGFVRYITYAAIGGVAIGVAALLLALAVVRGFSREIEAKIVGFGAHVQVESFKNAPLDDAARIRTTLGAMEGVTQVAPVVQELALLRRSAREIEGIAVWGTERPPDYLQDQIVAGAFSFEPDATGAPGLVIGNQLADLVGADVGDRVTVFSMRGLGEAADAPGVSARPRVRQFYIAGIYETSLSNFDELYAFTDVAVARRLFGYGPEQVTRFDVTLADVERAEETALAVEDRLGFPVMARSIHEVFRGLFAWVNLQESIIPVVISVIVIVGAFNIIGTLLMLILEKTREIGILESMGASARMLRRLFLWLGLLIGLAGTAIGGGLALLLGLIQQRYGVIPLPAEAYYMDSAPVELDPVDFLIVGAITLALCLAAAYIPARFAARIEPIRAIRFR